MVLEASEEEDVSVQFLLCVLRRLVRLLKLVRVFDRLIFVALVVAAGRLVVILPITHAHPAKLVLADFASHMVTTAIFLDRPLTILLWAHFRVCHDPCEILALRRALSLPVFVHFAVRRPVLLVTALEAERVPAEAVDHSVNICGRADSLHRILTFFRVGAPPNHSVVVCERLAVPSKVLLKNQVVVDTIALGEQFEDD